MVLTGLSVLGLALSGFLSWHYLRGGSMIGCGGVGSCDQVLSSRWSAIGGVVPVSGLAAGAYLAMLVCSLSIGPSTVAPIRRLAWQALLVLVGAAAGSAVWFTVVQKWMVGAFCPYCMATHLTGLLLAALVIWRASRPVDGEPIRTAPPAPGPTPARTVAPAAPRRLLGRAGIISRVLSGLALAGILAASQVGFAPTNPYRGGKSADTLPALDPHSVPLIGSPDAPYVVTLLFDYECPHCQQLHWMLGEAIRRYHNQLAFALCPAPLNSRCNPYIPSGADEFKDSCGLARIGLAVWVADRRAFPVFDRWMYSFDSGDRWHPRSLDAAKAKAIELVGRAKFAAAWDDPWINRYMRTCIHIFGETMRDGIGGVPKLVYGSRWVTPAPRDAAGLVSILQNGLAVPKP